VLFRSVTTAEPQRRKPTSSIAHISLAGRMPEGVGQGGMLADVRPHLHRIVERIEKVAKDERGIWTLTCPEWLATEKGFI
jgi:hypothetical protein